ncbi:MAG: enoyl-CoA hydratase/isomerase family protein [Ignavibacteriae bacterium]|nr:enoyl-CoA hydratase/isomerase family protein [Ignavibacteriota bacterium]MCB9217469.1 enoyl-CoA hydratase/isomerase family protein [Ignavibacteria bacterium]
MEYSTLSVERKGAYVIIRLNRPEALNALSIALLDDLRRVIAEVERDDSIRGAILTGAGEKAFAAGADIEELHELDGYTGKEYSERGQSVFSMIETLEKPIIAAVNGFALGGGCELAMSCHIRLASEKAKFGQPEVNLGIIPGFGGTQRLARLIGVGRAIEYNLTGALIDATTAERIGLANHVYPADELMNKAEEMMSTILSKGPIATQNTLRATMASVDLETEKGMEYEANLFGETCGTTDFKEGTEAFLEKRKAVFIGE